MNRAEQDKEQGVEYYESLSFRKEYLSPGSVAYFNIHYGYLEGILRGFRSGFLSETSYRTLCQVNKLEEFKVALVDTDYNGCLDDAAGDVKISCNYIVRQCKAKFTEEFMNVRTQATGGLKTFLDLIRMEYMIDNIILLLRGLTNKNDPSEILEKCEPLGYFPNMRSVLTYDASDAETGLTRLFETVLIDTPVGHLFERYFVDQDNASDAKELMSQLGADRIDVVAAHVKRLWLQEFYDFCRKLDGETGEQMTQLLEFEADKKAIRLMVNSFQTQLNEPTQRRDFRQKLFAGFGSLYPEGIIAFERVTDLTELGAVLQKYPTFQAIYEEAGRGEKDIEDCLLEEEVRLNEFAFWGQNHFAAFWGFVKLKEQELRNIYWIADCITANRRDPTQINKWIPILSRGSM